MRDVAILSAVRTADRPRAARRLQEHPPRRSGGARSAREAMRRAEVEPAVIEDVVLGCAHPEAEQGLNVARQVGFLAGLPDSVPAMTINRFCSSGLQAASIVADRIAAGGIDAGLAGGLESMSLIPMGGAKIALNPAVVEQFPDAYIPMGNTAENVARQFGVSRGDQDAFALASHQKAVAAQARGDFAAEILPVKTRVFDGEMWRDITVDKDEGPRADTSLEKLAALKPVFDPTGTRHRRQLVAAQRRRGGGRADGRATRPRRRARSRAPTSARSRSRACRRRSWASGPVPAVRKLLAKAGLKIDQIDLFEINEAFASQALYCLRELGLPAERVNVNGGAIALGHPLGARARARSRPRCTSSSAARAATPSSRCASAAAWARPG